MSIKITVKLANSTRPNSDKTMRMIKCVFHKEKLNAIDTVYEKHILSFSRQACCGNLVL